MISLTDIVEAEQRIRESIAPTPAPYSENLSREAANSLYLKLETQHVTGSFKERGALNRLLLLTDKERARGVVTASAGNHAQAVAYHASRRGIRVQICVPIFTPLVKVTATKRWGAEVILYGETFDEALQEARRREQSEGMIFVHGFDDDAVIAGQGTIGLELLRQVPDLEAVVVPIGGGGLIAGIACAIRETRPEVRVIGVQTTALPSMQAAVAAHRPVAIQGEPTIADGIAVRKAGEHTLELVEKYVEEIVTVDDEEIAMAILRLLERQKILAEGAGAAGVAAMLQRKTSLESKNVAVVIGGGNIDVTLLSHIIERGLIKDGRLVRLRITLADHPGALQLLTSIISAQRVNVVHVVHDRAFFGVHLGNVVIDLTAETRGADHVEELLNKLSEAGYHYERVM